MIESFRRSFRPEVGIDAAETDNPLWILGHFLGHDLIRFGIVGVRGAQRKRHGAVEARFVQIAYQIVAEKTGNAMPQRRLAATEMGVRVYGVKLRIIYA